MSAILTFLGRAKRRRTPWIVILACLIGIGGIIVTKMQERPRTGLMIFTSDDPNVRVVMEKDGQNVPLEQVSQFTMALEPGHYDLKLVGPIDGFKLEPPSFFNLDAGGRAFVRVKRVNK